MCSDAAVKGTWLCFRGTKGKQQIGLGRKDPRTLETPIVS